MDDSMGFQQKTARAMMKKKNYFEKEASGEKSLLD